MKYFTPRGKTILYAIGVLIVIALCRAVPTPTPPVTPGASIIPTIATVKGTEQPITATATLVPYCNTTAYTSAYRALLDKWRLGANQAELITAANNITTPAGCSKLQYRIIERLELATRQGIIAVTQSEILAAQKEMRATISALELMINND